MAAASCLPELRCHAVSAIEQFAQFALAGPQSRAMLAALLPHGDVSDAALPHLGILQTAVDGAALAVYRMSFSGERAYEIAIGEARPRPGAPVRKACC